MFYFDDQLMHIEKIKNFSNNLEGTTVPGDERYLQPV